MNATRSAMMSTMVRTKPGSRRRLLESLRTLWDRSFARRHVPAPRASSSANLTPVSSTDRCPSRYLRRSAILIANLELEFHVSPIRITKLGFSNRKYSPLFRPPWRIAISRSALSSAVARRQLRLRRPASGGPVVSRFLIVTPRLEFRTIKTKQTPSSNSNRYKMRFLAFRISGRKPQKRRRPEASGTNSKGQRAGPANTVGTRTARRMPALQGRQRYQNGAEKEKAKMPRWALRLRQRGCGIELWSDHERLRCT
jgi:hypothetical protein